MEIKKYTAITIGPHIAEANNLKKLDDVYDFLETYGVISNVVSRETDNLTGRSHFHVLSEFVDLENKASLYEKTGIVYIEQVQDVAFYDNYVRKEGKFKVYNDFSFSRDFSKKLTFEDLVNDIIVNNLRDLRAIVSKYPGLSVKYYHNIKRILQDLNVRPE